MGHLGDISRCPVFGRVGEVDAELKKVNSSIRNGRYCDVYTILNNGVIQALGPRFQLIWRHLDLNLLLAELKMCEFGALDWYTDAGQRFSILDFTAAFNALSPTAKAEVLARSVIEPIDVKLASDSQCFARIKEVQGNFQDAAEDYQKSLALDPHGVEALYNYADMLSKIGSLKEARKPLSVLLVLCHSCAMGWGLMALVEENEGMLNRAIECYETAYSIDRTSATRLRNYAMLLVSMARYDRAKVLYEEAIALDPTNGPQIAEYADMLHSMDLLSESEAAFERALATRAINSTMLLDYAALLNKMAKMTGKVDLGQKALSLLAWANHLRTEGEAASSTYSAPWWKDIDDSRCCTCGKAAEKRCTRCAQSRYCSRECQKAHWPQHKVLCKPVGVV